MFEMKNENDFTEICNSVESNIDIDTNNYQRSGDDISPLTPENTGSINAVLRIVLIFIFRAGYILIQIGSIPVTNVNLILLQNIIDICWISIVYFFIGSIIAFTGDTAGLLGGGYWIQSEKINKEEIIFGWQLILISSAISTTCIAGRIHSIGGLIIGFFLGGIIQPFVIHWTWTSNGWMMKNKLSEKNVYFRDSSGGSIVSLVGSSVGIIGCFVLGRRIMRVGDVDDASMTTGSTGTTFVGYLFVVIGLQSIWLTNSAVNNPGSENQIYQVMINTIISISSCTMIVIIIHFLNREPFNHWTITRCIQGIVAGVIVVSAGADVYPPTVALVLGAFGGILFYLFSKIIFQSKLEDYCNIFATNFICGLLGCLIVPFFHSIDDYYDDIEDIIYNFLWQFFCVIFIITIIIVIMLPIYLGLDYFGLLRNKPEVLNNLRSRETEFYQDSRPSRSVIRRFFFPNDENTLMHSGRLPVEDSEHVASSHSVKHEQSLREIAITDQSTHLK